MRPGDIIYAGPYPDLARYVVTEVDGPETTIVRVGESDDEKLEHMKGECLKSLKALGYSDDKVSELDELMKGVAEAFTKSRGATA